MFQADWKTTNGFSVFGPLLGALMVKTLGEALTRNEFIVHHEGRKVTDPELLTKLVGNAVPNILEFLAVF